MHIRNCSASIFLKTLLLVFPMFLVSSAWLSGAVLQVSEIMYHPAGTNLLEEWFEIQNIGTNVLDLSGGQVTRGVGFVFPANTRLSPGAFLVVAADLPLFSAMHPGVANVVGGWKGTLSRSGEEISIQTADGKTAGSVHYATEGDWAVRRMSRADYYNRQGWEWFAEHKGGGKSLELISPNLPDSEGQNWGASTTFGGTPGRPNSRQSTNTAPLITQVSHFPPVPKPVDPVIIQCRLLDESGSGQKGSVYWRRDGEAAFHQATMADDGDHGDGLKNDGVFGAVLPPQTNLTVVEFYIEARDAAGNSRIYPAVNQDGTDRTANLAYQVDDSIYAGDQPVYRLVMTQGEHDFLANRIWKEAPLSDALANGTFISFDGVLENGSTWQVRYNTGYRNRGHGTRTFVPHNFRLNFPDDRFWKGRSGLNLNTLYTHSQNLGSAVFRRLEVPMPDSRPVQVRVNGINLARPGLEQFGSYAANDAVDGNLLQRQFPSEPGGNLYRGIRDLVRYIPAEANLVWHGPLFSSYTNAYSKENNNAVNDWSDLLHLIDVLNNTPPDSYIHAITNVINVDQWMKYFAITMLLGNQENSLGNGYGDDYMLFRGEKDPRFRILPYDMDDVMGRGVRTQPYPDDLWRMSRIDVINRLIKQNEFAPIYFRYLKELAGSAFSPAQMNPLIDQLLGGFVDPAAIVNMKAFNKSHVAYVLSLVPQALSVEFSLTNINGYLHTTNSKISLSGSANAVQTRSVVVNQTPANYVAWQGRWAVPEYNLNPGINRISIRSLDGQGRLVEIRQFDVVYGDGSTFQSPVAITSNVTWRAVSGPFIVSGNLVVANGATLTVEPGTSIYFETSASLSVANGGRLLAVGTPAAPILFSRPPGSSGSWGGITVNGGPGSPETRITHAHFEFNNTTAIHSISGTVFLDHLSFGATGAPYVSLDNSSFVVSHCDFPRATSAFEGVHGTGGIKAGGRGIFLRNFFGPMQGYNDVIDFTGGKRTSPILQVINNVFTGTGDDILDLDGTDAWIEGNIFLHCHKNGSPDSASAISGGNSGVNVSGLTIVGNVFYDCDHALTAKQGNFYTFMHNTVVRQTKEGGLDVDAAVANFADDGTTEGAGAYFEGNIIFDAEKLLRATNTASVVMTNNLMPFAWNGPGGANSTEVPFFNHVPSMIETEFATWEAAQIMRKWLDLAPGSPGLSSGAHEQNLGGVIPLGVALAGVPVGTNSQTNAVIRVEIHRQGWGIPVGEFPQGSGFTHYRWSLDGSPFSGETPISAPIFLNNLSNDLHMLVVSGRRDSAFYQDDPAFAEDAVVATRTWVTDSAAPNPRVSSIRINEVLARNQSVYRHLGTTPDLVELYNDGDIAVNLGGIGLTDNAAQKYKFTFPPGIMIPARGHLVLFADATTGGPWLHTGFGLKPSGDDLHLYDRVTNGGALIDSVVFGIQIADYSIGRRSDGSWGLCLPTFGRGNLAQRTGNIHDLRINEWLADAQFSAGNDFVELYNPSQLLPVELGGLFLSDAGGSPQRHPISPLSFITPLGLTPFIADGDTAQGSDHLNFKLSSEGGIIILSDQNLQAIDVISYGQQRTDVSEGRSPNGGSVVSAFGSPTPGGGNPGSFIGSCTVALETIPLIPMTATWRYHQTQNLDGSSWFAKNFDDLLWSSGPALIGVEDCGCLPAPGLNTVLAIGRNTYYFRTQFIVSSNLTDFRLNFSTVIDDGAVIYLNGKSIITNSVNSPLNYAAAASRNVGNASLEYFSVAGSGMVVGTNVIAVEVHQTGTNSGDVVFGLSLEASRFYTNCLPSEVLPVRLSEILSSTRPTTNHVGAIADFIEIYNTSSNFVNLGGVSLTDDLSIGRKWNFPQDSIIAPGEYKVVYCNPEAAISSTNTGFGLSSRGGVVYLFDRASAGGSLLDEIQFGLQTTGFSVSRLPVLSASWNLSVPSPGAANLAAGLGSVTSLRVNEWMADPVVGDDWFEIFNTGDLPISLGGLVFTDDLADKNHAPVAPLSFVGARQHGFRQFFASGNSGKDQVDFALKKTGESLGLFTASGVLLDGVQFGLQQTGVSQGLFPDGADFITNFVSTASPSFSNYLPIQGIFINEILAHTELPLEDAIELANETGFDVNVGGWFLSNSRDDYKKFRIPDGTMVKARGYLVFYENQFKNGAVPFTLNSAFDGSVHLSQTDPLGNLTGRRQDLFFGPTPNGLSVGRHRKSNGIDFVAQTFRTFGQDNPESIDQFRQGRGAANSHPKVGPLIVSEIMYSPNLAAPESTNLEFVELRNVSGQMLALYQSAASSNSWRIRGGIEFDFPTNAVVPAGAEVLVVGFDPANGAFLNDFKTRYNIDNSVQIFGPWTGRLDNAGDSIKLLVPDKSPDTMAGFVPYFLTEQINYQPAAPWPVITAGSAFSIHRISSLGYGNEPTNWIASAPSPGRNQSQQPVDSDRDGMDDSWEISLFRTLLRDGVEDFDGDGLSDLKEFFAGTDPTDPESRLNLLISVVADGVILLEFEATAGRAYKVEFRADLSSGIWESLANVPASDSPSIIRINDNREESFQQRFYRLILP